MTDLLRDAATAALDTLAEHLDGDLYRPGDDGWDEARTAWNLAADQRPVAVVAAESAADVAHTIRAARAEGLRVAPQGTGHAATAIGDLSGTILLRARSAASTPSPTPSSSGRFAAAAPASRS
jgi:FAD/FMN-containing dehydrogenase